MLVRVHAAGVIPTKLSWVPTWTMRTGKPRPFPLIPGHEFSGEVAASGAGVTVLTDGAGDFRPRLFSALPVSFNSSNLRRARIKPFLELRLNFMISELVRRWTQPRSKTYRAARPGDGQVHHDRVLR